MKYGIYDIRKVSKSEEIVRCNNCDHYFYVNFTDERNNNELKLFEDKEFGTKYKEFFKGCPVCETDGYLTDIDLLLSTTEEINELQKNNASNYDEY